MKPRRPALGRGLDALLPPAGAPTPAPGPRAEAGDTPGESAEGDEHATTAGGERSGRPSEPSRTPSPARTGEAMPLRLLGIEQLAPDPAQPRRVFDEQALSELAESLRTHGFIQPIVVAPRTEGRYPIVAGERRYRAAQLAGIHEVPVVVRDTPDSERFELALVENLQRRDLDPIEEAMAFQQLIDVRGYTQERVAERVGKDRSTVANALRLLRLPPKLREYVHTGRLSMGHARALLGLDEPHAMLEMASHAIARKLSVRALERAVRERVREAHDAPLEPSSRRQIILSDLETRLRRATGVRARIEAGRSGRGPGTVTLPWQDLDELDRILGRLLAGKD